MITATQNIVIKNKLCDSIIEFAKKLDVLSNDWQVEWIDEEKVISWTLPGHKRDITVWSGDDDDKVILFKMDQRGPYPICINSFNPSDDELLSAIFWIE